MRTTARNVCLQLCTTPGVVLVVLASALLLKEFRKLESVLTSAGMAVAGLLLFAFRYWLARRWTSPNREPARGFDVIVTSRRPG